MKTRKVIGTEGVTIGVHDSRMLLRGALYVDTNAPRIPVVFCGLRLDTDSIVGFASEFERDETSGDLSMMIDLCVGEFPLKPDDLEYFLYASDIKTTPDRSAITSGCIRVIDAYPIGQPPATKLVPREK